MDPLLYSCEDIKPGNNGFEFCPNSPVPIEVPGPSKSMQMVSSSENVHGYSLRTRNPGNNVQIEDDDANYFEDDSNSPNPEPGNDNQDWKPIEQQEDGYDVPRSRHGPTKQLTCLVCQKEFLTRTNLIRHHRVHKAKKDAFQCPSCPKSFAQKQYLRIHTERKHSGIKHKCLVCGRLFADKYVLALHVTRIHHDGNTAQTRRKAAPRAFSAFKCTHRGCDKVYTEMNNLTTHMRTHHTDTDDIQHQPTRVEFNPVATASTPNGIKIENYSLKHNAVADFRKVKLEAIDVEIKDDIDNRYLHATIGDALCDKRKKFRTEQNLPVNNAGSYVNIVPKHEPEEEA